AHCALFRAPDGCYIAPRFALREKAMSKHWMFLAALPWAASASAAEHEAEQVRGDVVVIEEVPAADASVQPPRDIDVPARGMDMDGVRDAYGDPLDRHAAVGDPPITRWEYAGFSVFFEYDKVIHSVITQ